MKATGIVRRIDDLGRIVIPKEIRRTLRIREGDPLEIYTEKDGEVIFKKYSPMGEFAETAGQICETLYRTTNCITAVCDRDSMIAAAGAPKRELIDRRISTELEHIMEERSACLRQQDEKPLPVIDGSDKYSAAVAAPIITAGDLMGCVLFLETEGSAHADELEYKLAQTIAAFLARQLED